VIKVRSFRASGVIRGAIAPLREVSNKDHGRENVTADIEKRKADLDAREAAIAERECAAAAREALSDRTKAEIAEAVTTAAVAAS